ncbi:DNA-binding HxlR family transcriptional regulator [Streptomyces phaeochromogenes]|jgi:DNA-binding HxlR family transcriptional regulator|uniref:winged helix-turn-helix transcriptional regulator n=1 Tax=Streptomyces phaeochromogenes TaxID=1923 RepID=UPI00278E801E|nr:helix-turn-helix domain-containing protein [Streptomyces phaeochromogenes]MDQ0949949.1 DNA-binding HxlR family transcriptional regulator [Streptomyces phaeochromogenes]
MSKDKGPYSCGLDAAVDVVGGKWKPMILWALHVGGTMRFGELRRDIGGGHSPGISEKVLSQQLRELEADGVVHREVYGEVPPRVEYSLTELGKALNTALLPLGEWGDLHMKEIISRKLPDLSKEPSIATRTG